MKEYILKTEDALGLSGVSSIDLNISSIEHAVTYWLNNRVLKDGVKVEKVYVDVHKSIVRVTLFSPCDNEESGK